MAILIALHLLAAIIWVGGMFFAYVCLRPTLSALSPAERCQLWRDVLGRFFSLVWGAVAVLLLTGFAMIAIGFGGMAGAGIHIHLMLGVGILMMLLFAHMYFAPFARLRRAVRDGDWPGAGAQIGRIRPIVAINLVLGLAVSVVASAGRWI